MTALSSPEPLVQEQQPVTETPWEKGRISHWKGPKQLLFGHMYEDCERIEGRYFPAGSRVFSIASAGSTAIFLADDHHVTAVDLNPVQLEYARRRSRGAPAERGVAERLLARGRRFYALTGWQRESLKAFLEMEDPREQLRFWNERLNTAMFRAGMDALFSRLLMRMGYSWRFLAAVPKRFGLVLRERLERTWSTHGNRDNPYMHALFAGEVPPARRTARALDVEFAVADAANYLEACRRGSFDAFTFSNILDGASPAYRRRLFAATRRAASADAVVILRSFAQPSGSEFHNVAAEDRSPLWGVVDVRPVRTLGDAA
jgi:S-adenosylmethionine:diacylglycerol 3-amino-3-carboxypropyl transferase